MKADKPNTSAPPVKTWVETFQIEKDTDPDYEVWVWQRIPIEVVNFYKNDACKERSSSP